MPRARSRRSSIAWPVAVWRFASIDFVFSGSRSTSPSASRSCTDERDELLLRAVVQVALELAALLVLGVDESLARGAELLDVVHELLGERHVPHHQPGLRGEVADELLLRRRDRVAGRFTIDSAPSSSP